VLFDCFIAMLSLLLALTVAVLVFLAFLHGWQVCAYSLTMMKGLPFSSFATCAAMGVRLCRVIRKSWYAYHSTYQVLHFCQWICSLNVVESHLRMAIFATGSLAMELLCTQCSVKFDVK